MKKKMFFIFVGCLAFISLVAVAIDGKPIPKATRQDQRVTITLSIPELNIVTKGLGKLSLEESIDVFASIQRQVSAQLTPKQKIDSNVNSGRSQKKN